MDKGKGRKVKGEMNGESSMEAYTLPCVKYIANGKAVWLRELTLGLCNNLERWDGVAGEREVQEGGAYIYLWLIHINVWQKSSQYYKAIILQLKSK